ncbi:MAG: fused MFS/spermidine synthase [Acidobacteriia bacterium]|nr:fused MFS/spermidine synthase [Terriglobia bacterium]
MVHSSIDRRIILAIAAVGFTSIMTQTILLREFLAVFSGNELVIGIVLASWMILTGAGSFLGRFAGKAKQRLDLIIILFLLTALLPIATVFLLSYLRNLVFPLGAQIGLVESLYSSFLLLVPYCVTSGLLFTLFAQTASEQGNCNLIASVYSWESLGSIVGGFLFNLVLIFVLSTFQALILLTVINLSICFLVSLKYGQPVLKYAILLVGGLAVVLALSFNLDALSKRFLFRNQELLFYVDTPYGNLTLTQQGEQKNFYENSVLLFSTNDVMSNEEAVHYAMIQHPRPRSVILISGGISGTTREILKYEVDRIDYVELNPWIIEMGRDYTSSLTSPKLHVFADDARRFLRNGDGHYDVALVNVPDPVTAQINRYYTVEFLQLLKTKLNAGAVVSFSLLPSVDYQGTEARQLSSIMNNTLRSVFKNVLIVPGLRNYYLASDGPLDIEITRRIEQRGINNSYVNSNYVDDLSLRQRSEAIAQSIYAHTVLNRDYAPIAYYRQLLYWLSSLQFSPWIPGGVLILLLAVVTVKLNAISFGLFTGGFAASSMEILLLISFQIIYGYVYQATGLIITLFMTGLAAGSLYGQKRSRPFGVPGFIGTQFAIGIYSLLFPLILLVLKDSILGNFMVHAFFVILTFMVAALVGLQFSIASTLRRGKIESVASELYSIDLIGSAIGALVVSTFLVPLLGIVKVSLVVALLNFLSAVVTTLNRNRSTVFSESELAHV